MFHWIALSTLGEFVNVFYEDAKERKSRRSLTEENNVPQTGVPKSYTSSPRSTVL